MKPREVIRHLDQLQQTRGFKIGASVAVVAIAVIAFVAFFVAVNALPDVPVPESITAPEAHSHGSAEPSTTPQPPAITPPAEDPSSVATAAMVRDILQARNSVAGVAIAGSVGVALALVVIWLGLGITYIGLGVLSILIVLPTYFFNIGRTFAPLLLGTIALTAAFAALTQAARLLLSGPGVIFAIARTVLAEAVRAKVSLLFIVALIFLMAALPLLLDESQPLRYRVQSFLQYGTGGIFWLIAVLVLAFSVATVAFDQRDKTIWQTMTKPVSASQYVLGKWLGSVTVGVVLLAVAGTGVFMFTEYLRTRPAEGEKEAYVVSTSDGLITEDRLILETQVLTARKKVMADPPVFDEAQFEANVDQRVQLELERVGEASPDPAERRMREQMLRDKIRSDIRVNAEAGYRTIEPGQNQIFSFSGLQEARKSNRPIVLRCKITSGANMPDQLIRVTFVLAGSDPVVHEFVLGQFQQIQLLPAVIDENGVVAMQVFNGDVFRNRPNPEYFSFPKDGLEISYSAGSYRANFFRVFAVLLVKLAFLSMLGISTATFLSFPISCIVSFTVFFAAEGARYLLVSLETYATEDREGKAIVFNTIIAKIAETLGNLFKIYADLRPTGRLVDGLLLPWGDVATGTAVLLIWTAVLYMLGSVVLRRRELAIYSGH